MPFYAGTNHILQPNPILCIPDFRQSTNPQISVKAQPHADLLSSSFRFRAFLQFILHPNRLSTGLQGTLRFQVEPNWAHLDLFRELTI